MKLGEIAQKLKEHLSRFEQDPVLSKNDKGKTRFWNTGVVVSGRFIKVCYISYQGYSNLTKDEALQYLEKLDAGFVGQHFQALRGRNREM